MLNETIQKLKIQTTPLLSRIKQIQNMFSTAKDVYGDLLGIDLDDSAILAVQLSNPLGVARLVRFGAIGLPGGAISDDQIVENAAISGVLRQLIQTGKIRAKNVALAMPGTKVAIKEIKISGFLSDAEAENRAWQEARRTFPELVKSLFLDFAQVERASKERALVMVCCRREDILPRVECVQQAGLTPKIMDVDFYALERAYPLFASQLTPNHVNQYVAIIDFNPRSLVFLVIRNKNVVFRMRQAYMNDALIPIVQRAMQLAVSAVKAKPLTMTPIAVSLQTPQSVIFETQSETIHDEQKTHVLMAIRRLFQSFYAENPGKVIEQIAFSGKCALLPEMVNHVAKSLEIPVKSVNPFLSLKMGEQVDSNRAMQIGTAFTLSCGLALRGIPLWK